MARLLIIKLSIMSMSNFGILARAMMMASFLDGALKMPKMLAKIGSGSNLDGIALWTGLLFHLFPETRTDFV